MLMYHHSEGNFFLGGGEHCEFMGAYFSRLLNDVFFPPPRLSAQKKKKKSLSISHFLS